MTFATTEVSRKDGKPIALYFFRYGSDAASYYAYTDAEQEVTAPGAIAGTDVTYSPIPIKRGAIGSAGTLDKATLELRLQRDLPLAADYVGYPPSVVMSLVIRQAHVGVFSTGAVLEAPVIWSGRILSVSFEGSEAKLTCEPISTSMRRTGLRRRYQVGCPHALYGDECRADKVAATIDVNITSVDSNKIIMPAAWFGSIAVTKYLGGLAQWTTPEGNVEIRTILSTAAGKDLVLNGIIRGLVAAQTVSVSLGCNHLQDDCSDLHVEDGVVGSTSNIHNYGGQDWIPDDSPIGQKSQFY